MTATLRVGVIGTGEMGAAHVRMLSSIISRASVGAVHDADLSRARSAAAPWPDIAVLEDPKSLISDAAIDCVLVATPDDTHAEFVTACIAANKPVLCEKPLAPTAAACQDIVDAELAAGRRLVTVGFMRRYDSALLGVKQQVDSGSFGAVLMIHCAHRNRSMHVDSAERLITGSAIHEFDMIRWLGGDELAWAGVHRPRRSSRVEGAAHDPLFLVLESRGGILADVEVFLNAGYGYDVRCEVVGEVGAVLAAAPPPVDLRRDGAVISALPMDYIGRFADAYRAELQAWVDGVLRGEQHGANAWDGYAASAVADAAIASLATEQRSPVSLGPRPSLYPGLEAR